MKQQPNDIYKGNAFEFEFSVQEKAAGDATWIPTVGLADLKIWISATDGGNAIDAALQVGAAERAGKPGHYYGKISGANITAKVFPIADGTEFFVVGKNDAGDILVSSSRRAWNVRRV